MTGTVQPGLVYVDEPHGYTWQGIPKPYATGIIKDVGLGVDFEQADPEKLAYRARVGKAFHLAAQLLVTGRLDPTWSDAVVNPYVNALRNFISESGAKCVAAEVSLYPELHGFGVTLDSVWMLNGQRVIIEYKTRDASYPSDEYQTWAQEMAWNEVFPKQPAEGRFALHLKDNERYKLRDMNQRQAYNYTYLLWMWKERKRNGLPCHV